MRLIATYILVACIAFLAMEGCESDSSTEPVSNWATVDSLDFQVFIGDFSGYRCVDQSGNLMGVDDTRDWVLRDLTFGTRDDGDDDDEPDIVITLGAYPNPTNSASLLRISSDALVDIDLVVYNADMSWVQASHYDDIGIVTTSFLIRFDDYDLSPGLYRVFIRMINSEDDIAKWSYGDIMYDPDYEWE